ncbi:extracellular solute-binding protein [Paenibacillus favisporus]|uniref:extracellular solute-binding protein n=1 Tax=Paenibacillus TaxID=44249 RepID=UPI0011AB5E15|nr:MULTISPECIES: extracellular solute-binding protein [Paenibacillus]MEC0176615.1 extracellular solute-binding protein [Paenibacillus favisporus]
MKTWANSLRLLLTVVTGTAVIAGCSGGKTGEGSSGAGDQDSPYTVVNVYKTHLGKGKLPKNDDPHVKYIAEKTGVQYNLVTTSSGGDPVESMNVMIASGDLPDIMRPVGGVEQTLISQGGALALDELLPKYAPHVWERIPEEAWNIVRSATDDGKIYYVPKIYMIPERAPMIRQDWLDKLGLQMPKTKDDYVNVLTAFLNGDPNGNGTKDELPTTGREFGTWMDHLFGMYGVAMWEGKPEWDIYDGKLQYAGVTENMKAAIQFIRELYEKKLLDNETFLNKGEIWTAKINNNLVGSWYHLPANLNSRLDAIEKLAPDVNIKGMPMPTVEGFKGFVTQKSVGEPEWLIPKVSEDKAEASLKLLDFFYDPANADFVQFGIEGIQHEVVDGKKQLLPADDNRTIGLGMLNYNTKESMDVRIEQTFPADRVQMIKDVFATATADARRIAGDGMPVSAYEGYPDIQSHKLFQEYLSKIVIGEWPIEKFDEFVDKWKKSGGDEVTKRAQAWYDKVKQYQK